MSKLTYWEKMDPPMSFIPEKWTFEQKREFRYKCIPYLLDALNPERFRGKRVLCVGDGSGIDAVELARHGAYVSVIDMSEKAVELTRQHAAEAGVEITAWVGDATNIDLNKCVTPLSWSVVDHTGTFDMVYSFGVIHHIPAVDKAVCEIARVLKPGGLFVGMVYNRDSLLYAYSILARGQREGLTPDEAMHQYSERNPGCPHSVAYTRAELTALFLGNGFQRSHADVRYDVIDLPAKRKVPFSTDATDLGWHLWFNAIK